VFVLPGHVSSLRAAVGEIIAIALICLSTIWASPLSAETQIQIHDIAGRHVVLDRPARRILLAQGRHLPALALIHPDPVSILAGWQSDMQRQDAATYELFRRKFPALDAVPVVGNGVPENFSIERALALKPDVAILSWYVAGMQRGSAEPSAVVKRFESAGIPVVIVDFFANPLRDTSPSIRILGKVVGREREADAFLQFYEGHLSRLKDTLAAKQPRRPTVFMHAHAGGNECCYSSGKGTFDDFISLAGGRNIAADVIPGSTGQISLEYLIARNPEVYVATGGAHLAASGGLVLGTGVDPDIARRRFAELLARPGLSGLSAVTAGRAHALWHMFNDSPSHVVALEWLAKWFHPELFGDIDPAETMKRLNAFSAVPLEGAYWVEKP
jgi:iron complex transport system substrate-binding protein